MGRWLTVPAPTLSFGEYLEIRGEDLICGVHEWDYRFRTGVSSYNPEEKLKVEVSEEDPAIVATREKSCLKCGFPLKDGDKYCQFCHSSLVKTGSRKAKTIMKAGGAGRLITPKRMVITVVVFLIVLIWAFLMR